MHLSCGDNNVVSKLTDQKNQKTKHRQEETLISPQKPTRSPTWQGGIGQRHMEIMTRGKQGQWGAGKSWRASCP